MESVEKLLTPPGFDLEIGDVPEPKSDSARVAASFTTDFKSTGLARRSGQSLVLRPLFPASWHDPLPQDSTRVLPVWLDWVPVVEERLEIVVPAGMHALELPQVACSNAVGEYRLSSQQSEGRVVLERRLAIHQNLVPPERWAEARALLREVYRGDNATLVLR